jgi:hypothetical protein
MGFKPETSLAVALATATVVYAIHQNATPSIADVRSLESNNVDVQKAERAATWTSAGIVAGISLLAKDATIFIIGGSMVIAMAWMTRHADQVDTITKRASSIKPTDIVGNTSSGVTTAPAQERVPLNTGTPVYSASVF